jgi:hypothetical protein
VGTAAEHNFLIEQLWIRFCVGFSVLLVPEATSVDQGNTNFMAKLKRRFYSVKYLL